MHPSRTRISCRIASIAPPSRRKASTSGSAWDKAAKAKGIYHGRKPSVPVERVREMRAAAPGPTAIPRIWRAASARSSEGSLLRVGWSGRRDPDFNLSLAAGGTPAKPAPVDDVREAAAACANGRTRSAVVTDLAPCNHVP